MRPIEIIALAFSAGVSAYTLINTVIIKRMIDALIEPVPAPRPNPALVPFPRFS